MKLETAPVTATLHNKVVILSMWELLNCL